MPRRLRLSDTGAPGRAGPLSHKRNPQMSIGFLNLVLLAGLAALAIPPIIHFLSPRRHDIVDWGAMQFLLVSPAKRRRFMIE